MRLTVCHTKLFVAASCALLILLSAFLFSVSAQTNEQLAAKYAPVLHFTAGEQFYPTTVDYIIEISALKQRAPFGVSSTVIDPSPRADTLGTYTAADLFLDNKLGTYERIAADYSARASSLGYYAYVHVVRTASSTVIQYWLFYIYNNGPLNDHQGDIEVIQVFLDASGNPRQVLLSQHGAGQNAVWSDVEKVDDHPVVYVAQGSHANYFRSYQGRMGLESDIVGNDGKTIMPADLNLVMLENQGWLNFAGRWGYWGTEDEVALGQAGPYGPVFNQDGIRWAQPEVYLNSTFTVNGTYFILALLVANFLLLFVVYIIARGAWKCWCIVRMVQKGGLLVGKFLRGRGSIGLILGIVAIVLNIFALFLPWYTITAVSQSGPLAQQGGATLMNMDGINGVTVKMFMGAGGSDSTSGYTTLFTTQMPFAIAFGAGLILLALDVIGIKSGKSLGKKLMIGTVSSLLPLILILLFISQLGALAPLASGLFPGQTIPTAVENMLSAIARSPIQGTSSEVFPIIGVTTVTWGLGIGAYLFIVAAVLKLVGGLIIYTAPPLQQQPQMPYQMPPPPPPPPPPIQNHI
ncbi:MAG: hypothetical protein N3D85_01970 [Candidatus Bathyarchaeota archaeon]|nr:hypothetical protein [Candidatus Bathyarchaeota archaeon]